MAKLIDGGWYQPGENEKTYIVSENKQINCEGLNVKFAVTASTSIEKKTTISAQTLKMLILDQI